MVERRTVVIGQVREPIDKPDSGCYYAAMLAGESAVFFTQKRQRIAVFLAGAFCRF